MANVLRRVPLALATGRLSAARRRALEGAVVATAALVVLVISSHLRSTQMNNYVRLADALLHGHLWIDWPGRWLDAVAYRGRHYGVDGPFPALLLLPLVAVFGTHANQTLVAIAVGVLATWLAWALFVRLGVRAAPRRWLTLFFFAGTDLWWCAELGDVWFLAHLCAVAATLAIFHELVGRRRGVVLGLLAIAAIESRNVELLALPFVAWATWTGAFARAAARGRGDDPRELRRIDEPRALLAFAAVLAAGACGWVALNEATWGVPIDIGHTLYYHEDAWGHPTGSPFSLAYLPYQFYSFFLRAPEFVEWLQVATPPYLRVNQNGIALTFTSPALALAFFARRPRGLVVALWITTALVAAPDFLYYLNGWYQFGMRHALDFEPFLLVLMALAVPVRMPRVWAVLCAYSALVGVWGVWWWNAFMRTGD